MFNVEVFIAMLTMLTLIVIATAGVMMIVMHRWWPVRLVGLLIAIVAVAATIGVAAA